MGSGIDSAVKHSEDEEVLSSVIKSGGHDLGAVWCRSVSLEMQKSIDDFQYRDFFKENSSLADGRVVAPDSVLMSEEKFIAECSGISGFVEDVLNLKQMFMEHTNNKRAMVGVTLFAPGGLDAGVFHRDPWNDDELERRLGGVAVFKTSSEHGGGDLQYIDRPDVDVMVPVASKASCRFSCMDEERIKSMPVNALGVLQHGTTRDGLIHRGTAFDDGYRWRVMFSPL